MLSYQAAMWCHFAFFGTSLDVHVSSAQCAKTLFVVHADVFFQYLLGSKWLWATGVHEIP